MGNLFRCRGNPLLIVLLVVMIAVALLPGCSDYRFGDVTVRGLKFRQHYCNLTPGAVKEAAHERAKDLFDSYPDASWCDGVGFVIEVVHDIEVD